MPAPQHKKNVITPVHAAVLTVSDTRTSANDRGGQLIQQRLIAANHRVHAYAILKDEPDRIAQRVRALASGTMCHVILLTGGTGLAARDTTYEAIVALLDKRLDGFGELFRMLSHEQVGPAAMLSRAVAGLHQNTAIFAMPGAPKAVELAMDKLILPELPHIAWLAHDSR